MTTFMGPAFDRVEEVRAEDHFGRDRRTSLLPLLVKGAVRAWPAWTRWSFDHLAALRHEDGREVVCQFQDGLVEQGRTKPLPILPVGPYLMELSQAAQDPLSKGSG